MSDGDLLTLQQWLSPAFPVGGFAWSHGLETAISSGAVGDADALFAWLETVISAGSGAADATLLAAAMAPGADTDALALLAAALAGSGERAAETDAQGAAFTTAANALTGKDFPPAPLPVAVGRAARGLDLAPTTVAAHYLQAFAANLVSAAVRFIPLGATEGQAVLQRLRPTVLDTAARAAATAPGDIALAQPAADIASLAHETLPVRIFRS
ncbi:MAG: urease accessory UreF family protein [Paracoccaceae bacterium]|nr:urease accessory UreF family protein [Paracoccaceae bacterium]